MSVVGILADDVDPMVSVMKVEKAPSESYADIGGLHDQVVACFPHLPTAKAYYCTSFRFKRSKRPWSFLSLTLSFTKKSGSALRKA